MHNEELEIVMWRLLFDGKEDEQTVALGGAELNNEIILMEGNFSIILNLVLKELLLEKKLNR